MARLDDKLREALAAGLELYRQKDYARAEPLLSQIVDAKLPYADVYNMLGVIHHHAGRFPRAQQCFQEALRINPSYTEASLNLSVTYNDMGKYAEAKELTVGALTSQAKHGGKLDAYIVGKIANMYADIAEVYASAGAFDEAVAEYRRALALRPAFSDIRLRLAECLRDGGHANDALRELRSVVAQNPDNGDARIHLGLTLFSTGDGPGSLRELDAILETQPDNKRARLYADMIRAHTLRAPKG